MEKMTLTEDNFHELNDKMNNLANVHTAVITREKDDGYKIAINGQLEVYTKNNSFLVHNSFNRVVFWDFKGVVGESSLAYSRYLTEVEFSARPYTPLVIEEHALENCPALTYVKFQEGLEDIGAWAFSNCPALAGSYESDINYPDCGAGTLKLPSTVKRIRTGAFYGSVSIRRLYVPADCVVDEEVDGWLVTDDRDGPGKRGHKIYCKIVRY